MKLSNEKGITIIGVMVAMGLLGIVSTGVMQLSASAFKMGSTFESRYEVHVSLTEIKYLLHSKKNCTNTFIGKNPKMDRNDESYYRTMEKAIDDEYAVSSLQKEMINGSGFKSKFKAEDPDEKYYPKHKIRGYYLSDSSEEVSVTEEGTTFLNIILEFQPN